MKIDSFRNFINTLNFLEHHQALYKDGVPHIPPPPPAARSKNNLNWVKLQINLDKELNDKS